MKKLGRLNFTNTCIESEGAVKKGKDGEVSKSSGNKSKKTWSEQDLQKISFGEKVWKEANDFRNEINKFLNPLWNDSAKESNKSGIASNSARLLAIRKHCWPVDCEIRAVNTVKARLNKVTPKKSFHRGDPTCQQLVAEAIAKWTRGGMPVHWYPQYWLTFILCGKPAGTHVKLSLNSGENPFDNKVDTAVKPATEILKDVRNDAISDGIANIKTLGSRNARRAASVAASTIRPPTVPKSTIEVRHIHQRDERELSKVTKLESLVDIIQKRKREIFEDLNFLKEEEPRDEVEIQKLTKQFKVVSEQLRDARAKQVEAANAEMGDESKV